MANRKITDFGAGVILGGELVRAVRSGADTGLTLGNAAGSDTGKFISDSGSFVGVAQDTGKFVSDSGSFVGVATDTGKFISDTGQWVDSLPTNSIEFIINGGGAAPITGIWGDLEIPFGCTITAARIVADASGSAVVDIWKDTYANFPPVDADSITASAPPTLSGAIKAQDTTLTGWTTSIAAGDWLRFNLDSVTTCRIITVTLTVTKT